jgi:thiol-disulfide isomerase/thioredoxin
MLRLELSALILLATLAPTPLGAAQTASPIAPVRDAGGHRLNLFGEETKAAVLIFMTNECPITNSYIPEINRIAADYGVRKIAFYAVYPDPTISIPAIRKHARDFGLNMPLIPDPAHDLVHRVGATVTPEAAVLERSGKLVYLGRIDDWYVDIGKRRPEPTQRYLRQALDAVLGGKPVATRFVNPVGCSIYPN